MKTYFTDLFEKFKRFSKKLDDLTLLTNKHWVIINGNGSKIIYIFQNTGILLISTDGKVTKANWEYLGNNSLLIDLNNESFLYKQGFIDDNILALKIDSKQEYTLMVNESQFEKNINSIEEIAKLLENQYVIKNSFHLDYPQGNNIIEINNKDYRIIDGFNEGYAVILNENLDYGFINSNNELIKGCNFEYAENFSCGLALVRYNNKFGFIDNTLNYVISPIYDHAQSFKNNTTKVTKNKITFDIDLNGKPIN